MDFLIHPTTQRVQKIVLHSNTPGEVLFGRYAKCRWIFRRGDGEGASATSEDGNERVKAFLQSANADAGNVATNEGQAKAKVERTSKVNNGTSRTERPLLLDRVADSGDGLKLDRTTGERLA